MLGRYKCSQVIVLTSQNDHISGHLVSLVSDPIYPVWNGTMTRMSEEEHRESHERHSGLVVEEAEPAVKQPSLYNVLLLNDDYTPMEFVVDVLERFFRMDRSGATRVMLEVHVKGKGICGVFTHEIAETKVAQVSTYARDNHHPLLCTLEEA
jgi:ATP-dependent Clp protease adaptor protein ClpS